MATRYQRGIRIPKTKDRQSNGHKIPMGESESVKRRTDKAMVKRYQRGGIRIRKTKERQSNVHKIPKGNHNP